MPSLRGTVTEQNLENAFAWESQANPRYLYFKQRPTPRASTRSPTGSRRSPRLGRRTPAASKKRSTRFDLRAPHERFEENWTTIEGKHGRKD